MFQIKNFVSIVASMLNYLRREKPEITDLAVGSAVRTLLEAPATEIEETYMQMLNGLSEASLVSTFKSFGFEKRKNIHASGYVRIDCVTALMDDITIPQGHPFIADDGRKYTAAAKVVWSKETRFCMVPATADKAGYSGNVIGSVKLSSPGFETGYVLTFVNMAGGLDEEPLEEVEARFRDYIYSLSRAVLDAVVYGAKSVSVSNSAGEITEYYTRSGVTEIPGFIRIFLYSSLGVPSKEILALSQRTIDGYRDESGKRIYGYRAGGIKASVVPMTEKVVNLALVVQMQAGFEYTEDTAYQIKFIAAREMMNTPAGDVLIMDDLMSKLSGVTGIRKIYPVSSENIPCRQFEVLLLGNLTISQD